MSSARIAFPREASILAALLALACASCTTPPPVNEAVMPAKGVNAPTRPQDAQRPKEPPAPPNTPAPRSTSREGELRLDMGVRNYEEGEYKTSAKQLQAALDLGLDAKRDQAKAHKYLAFIACASGRKTSCRNEFNKALDADPKFDLAPAEAGHPIWGPVWRSVKATNAAKSMSK
jgi:Tfp pilus assembly protein PilF